MTVRVRKLLFINSSTLRLVNHSYPLLKSARHFSEGNGEGASVGSLCRRWIQKYRDCDIPDPESSAELIIAHVLGKKMIHEVPANVGVDEDIRNRIDELCSQRLERKPVQYIIGEWDFIDITLKMRPPVLIPRPETEELCERILSELAETGLDTQPLRFLDIGCGSGAIALYLLKQLMQATCTAVDKSSEACDLTLENATRLLLSDRISVLHGDITQDDTLMKLRKKGDFDMIISNPPYIPTVDMETLMPEVQRYESHEALHGGRDGLDIIRRILHVAGKLLKTEGILWLETDIRHPPKIKYIAEEYLEFTEMFTDFTNRERFCKLKRKKN